MSSYCDFSDLPKDMCGCQDCRPDGVRYEDFVIVPAGDGHDAFMVVHGPCAERVLFTQVCHMDTLVRIAAEHTCIEPDPDAPVTFREFMRDL